MNGNGELIGDVAQWNAQRIIIENLIHRIPGRHSGFVYSAGMIRLVRCAVNDL